MRYSQKYCLVAFLEPGDTNTEFEMADWPLHITLADVFAVDAHDDITRELANLLAEELPVAITVHKEAFLGETKVVLFDKSEVLTRLHNHVIDLLELHGAIFNNPEFIKDGFLPHSTIQGTRRLHDGDVININTISLIDMFPNSDWRLRKVLQNFTLNVTSP